MPVTLSEFATRLLDVAADPERVATAASCVIENPMTIGPLRAGPGGIARASAICYVGIVSGRRIDDDAWDMVLDVPVRVGAKVAVAGQRFKFGCAIELAVRLRIKPADDLAVIVDVDAIGPDDVTTRVHAQDIPAKVVSLGYNVEADVVRLVIAHANEMIGSDRIMQVRRVDVAQVIDRAWTLGAVLPETPQTVDVPEEFEAPDLGEDDPDRDADERPRHQPTLELPFPPKDS